ncbi:hypothetical protein NFI96_015720 [Prochilodus magdalenae]|nr:hypothetical protein NFI96_015720 [Prochilodus magdalenae]
MATLLGESLFKISAQGPAPMKDFFYFEIRRSELSKLLDVLVFQVIWRWWKISLRTDSRNTKPGEVRESHSDYVEDKRLQSQVAMVFGPHVLQYSKDLCQGQYDYLQRLPEPLLLNIMVHLELEDIARFARTCRKFKELCSSEEFWEQTVRLHCDTVTAGMEDLAKEVGWRSVFFTNKLQLQKQISRRKLKSDIASVGLSPTLSGLQVDSVRGHGDWTTEPRNGLK